MAMDIFDTYKDGLRRLLQELGRGHKRYPEALTLQSRLSENIENTRRYDDDETLRANRARTVDSLNRLALQEVGVSFNELCKGVDTSSRRPRFLWFPFGSRWNLKLYRDRLRSQLIRLYVFGTVSNLLDIYTALKLVENPETTLGSTPGTAERLDIEDVLPARRVVILGEPGSGKTTLLKHLALRLATRDITLGSVVRVLSPHPLGKHIDNLHKGLLYMQHPEILIQLWCLVVNLMKIVLFCGLIGLVDS